MDCRLSKIDPELRQEVKNTTKAGKVHGNKETAIVNKDKKEGNREKNQQQFKKKLEKQRGKKVLVDAVKDDTLEVDAFRGKESEALMQGRFLDTKR